MNAKEAREAIKVQEKLDQAKYREQQALEEVKKLAALDEGRKAAKLALKDIRKAIAQAVSEKKFYANYFQYSRNRLTGSSYLEGLKEVITKALEKDGFVVGSNIKWKDANFDRMDLNMEVSWS